MADIPPSTFKRNPDFGLNRVEPRRYGVGRYGRGRYSPSDPTRFAWARTTPAALTILLSVFIALPAAADTLTPDLNLIKISEDVEDPLRTWGSKEDENKDILDAAICDRRIGCTIEGPLVVVGTLTAVNFISESSVTAVAPLTGDGLITNPLGVDSSSVTLLGPSIGLGEIDPGAVTTSVLGLSAVTTTKIDDDAVTRNKIAADGCTAGQILQIDGGGNWNCDDGAISQISTFTYLVDAFSTTLTTLGPCIAGSTMTLVLTEDCTVDYIYNGMIDPDALNKIPQASFLVDGAFPAPYTAALPMSTSNSISSNDTGRIQTFKTKGLTKLSAGSHDFCFTFAGLSAGTIRLNPTNITISYLEVRTRLNCNE